MPLANIVGISELAQAVASIFLQEPDQARARPSRFFKKKSKTNEFYSKIFNSDYPIGFYPKCAFLRKKVSTHLRVVGMERRHRTNLLHYVMMVAAAKVTKAPKPSIQQIADLNEHQITVNLLNSVVAEVKQIYEQLGANDKVAKGPELVKKVKALL